MRVLAFDTSCAKCSAVVWQDGNVLARADRDMERGHAEALVPMIGQVMAAAGLEFAALDRLGVTVGPGSFTGLRVGLATARGLALASGRPVVGVTTFEGFAEPQRGMLGKGCALVVLVDSRRAEPFAQAFDNELLPLGVPKLLDTAGFADLRAETAGMQVSVAGNGVAALNRLYPDNAWTSDPGFASLQATSPDCLAVASLAATRAPVATAQLRPLYLRAPDAKLPSARLSQASPR